VIASPLVLTLAAVVAQPPTITAGGETTWTVHEQLQVPAMTANQVVGGLGFAVAPEREAWSGSGSSRYARNGGYSYESS